MLGFAALVGFLLSLAVVAEESTPIQVAHVHRFCEGPVFDSYGNLYVSHPPFISKIAPDGTVTPWAKTGHPNGHKILADGTHLVADQQVLQLNADGVIMGVAASTCGAHLTRKPNDISIDPDGGFYFTDPGTVEEGALERNIGRVCYAAPNGETHLIIDGLYYPNGIVLRPDRKSLVVGELAKNRVLEYELLSAGKVSGQRVLVQLPEGSKDYHGPDGMALDTKGNLYIAHFGEQMIHVVDRQGALLRSLPAGNTGPSNVAFGGTNMNYLYITGGGDVTVSDGPGFVYKIEIPGATGLNAISRKRSMEDTLIPGPNMDVK